MSDKTKNPFRFKGLNENANENDSNKNPFTFKPKQIPAIETSFRTLNPSISYNVNESPTSNSNSTSNQNQNVNKETDLEPISKTNEIEHLSKLESIENAKTWDNEITLETFGNWINVSAYKIECLDLAIKTYRSRLQKFILLSLILSTISGTISVAQFGNYSASLKVFLNTALTISSFVVALLTGAVKTLKLQENLEEYIHLKQRWVSLTAKITNEIYLPKRLRRNAEVMIGENKGLFLDLLKIDIYIPNHMSVLAAKHLDKGDDIESQYYKYRDNIIKNEKGMNSGCMRWYSFFYDCCKCCYSDELTKKIEDNNNLAKTIKYSQKENASSYKRKAYQYTLPSIMLNNVKHECEDLKNEHKHTVETQTVTVESEPVITATVNASSTSTSTSGIGAMISGTIRTVRKSIGSSSNTDPALTMERKKSGDLNAATSLEEKV
jgi:hypothetical protein